MSSQTRVLWSGLGTNQKCPDYQGVLIFQVSLYDKAPFGTITKCVDYAGVFIFQVSRLTGFTVLCYNGHLQLVSSTLVAA